MITKLTSISVSQALRTGDVILTIHRDTLIKLLSEIPNDALDYSGCFHCVSETRNHPSKTGGFTHFQPVIKTRVDSFKEGVETKGSSDIELAGLKNSDTV